MSDFQREPEVTLTCDECGSSRDVRLISFKRNQRVVREALCLSCKERMLVRVRVRKPLQRKLLDLRRTGLILIAAGVLAFLAMIVWLVTG